MTGAEWSAVIGTAIGAAGAVWHKLNASLGSSKDGSLKDAMLRFEGKFDAHVETMRSDVSTARREIAETQEQISQLAVRVGELEERANGT